jgi:tRNA A-37 threonylcarbamoyl transferase component Bud32
MPPMTGRVIAGRYNLQHPIGRGAMGVVWRARDQILDRDVAVKEVVISSLISEEERRNAYKRTLREARTAARLSHRGLVAVYDVAEEDGRPWIVMELVPSRSLDQVLTVEGRLASLRVARIGQQLLSALAAAHIAGVLHRDVKPSNVLIATDRTGTGWDERAVLTDFGIAQFEGDPRLTQTGMVMGSPGFTAPERIRGGDATPASDLWSLGATLYAAVEGRGPYEQRGGAITTMSAIINEDAPVAAHAGRLAPVIDALLRRDPSSRPTATAAARMFAYVLPLLSATESESPAPAHPPTAASPARPSAGAIARSPARPPGRVPASGSSGPAKPEPARELAAAAAPAAIAAPAVAAPAPAPAAAVAVAATTAEDGASAIARPSVRRSAEGRAPTPAAPTPAPAPSAPALAVAAPAPSAAAPSAAAPASAEASPSAEAAAEPVSADAPATDPVTEPEPEPATEPSPGAQARGAKTPEAGAPEAASEVEAAENTEAADPEVNADAAEEATPTPSPGADEGDDADADAAAGRAAEAGLDAAADGDADSVADVAAEPADEAVSAVDAVSAVEAPQTPDDIEDAGPPVAADAAVGTADRAETGTAKPGADDSVTDPRPTRSRQQPKPKPAPTFTAARPGERPPAPSFSAARPDQPGTAQRTPQAARGAAQPSVAQSGMPPYWPASKAAASPGGQWSAAAQSEGGTPQYGPHPGAGASAPGAGSQYPGPSKQYADLATQYPPAPVGGTGQRRRGSRWWIIVVICAVLVAAAIGAGTALALRHNNNGSSGTGTSAVVQGRAPTTDFGSVNALNNQSASVPAGWTTETVTPSTDHTTAGFTVDVPPGWTEKPKGLATYFYGDDNMVLDVDLSPHTYPDNMVQEAEHLQQQQAVLGDAFPGYQRLQLEAVPVRDAHGAFWQFTWSLKSERVRTDDILFVLPTSAGKQSYAVYIRAPNDGWNSSYLPIFEKILPTFEPVTTS